MQRIKYYFPNITQEQESKLTGIYNLYTEWNNKINLISRKDINNLYEKHILHSMGIAAVIRFTPKSTVMDAGTGGGLPGIPLAIFFPQVHFVLIDSIRKKVKAIEDIVHRIGLTNVECRYRRIEEENQMFDFVVSRAVMPLQKLIKVARKNICHERKNALPNGFLCLKGGELQTELHLFKYKIITYELSDYFKEDFFQSKKVIYIPA